jgi:hypothetical protein
MNPEDRAALARYRERRRRLEAELQAVASIIDGFEALDAIQSARRTDEGRDQAPSAPTAEESDAAESADGMFPVDPDVQMTARDATLRIYREKPGAYRARHIADEIRRRGWTIDSSHPEQAIRTALLRLVDAGELTRVAHGLYDLAESGDQSTQPQSNGARELVNETHSHTHARVGVG